MKFKRGNSATVALSTPNGDVRREAKQLPDAYEDLLGPSGSPIATVSVTTDVRVSVNYGNVAGCWATVTLNCAQTEDKLVRAGTLARKLAHRFADEGQAHAAELLLEARDGLGAETVERPLKGNQR